MMTKIYFDHNATTVIRPEVIHEMTARMAETGNASSTHAFGRDARRHVEMARRKIATLLDVDPQQVIFNSGATEGNNTVLRGFEGQTILASAIEHPAVLESGVDVVPIPVTRDGIVDLEKFSALLQQHSPALVSVMYVNNETGVIQPVAEIARLAKAAGAKVHCDAVQAFGRIPFTRASLNVDFLTLSAHKIGGPQGVGALVIAPGIHPHKLLQGGGQERRQRAGTENVAGIAGFGVAAEMAVSNIPQFENLSLLRDKIEAHVLASSPRVQVHGQKVSRVANTTMLTIDKVAVDTIMMAFDLEGVAVSAGSACSSGSTRLSYVLCAMGVFPPDLNVAPVRISLGYTSTEKEVEEFLRVWDKLRDRIFKD